MKHSYLLAGIKFSSFVRMVLRNNGFCLLPRYFLRFLFLLQGSIWATVFVLREKYVLGSKIRNVKLHENPIFIIGHWRTGSTFLHQLMSLDENIQTPTVFQVSMPEGFLLSRNYYKPVMDKVMQKNRPMDNVKLGFDEPQEDEYALLKLVKSSPLEKLVFPRKWNINSSYFLTGYNDFVPNEKDLETWKNEFKLFMKRLSFDGPGRQLLFKNPFHSMRLDLLYEMFPNARFIHIYRDPLKVVPSTIRMWDIVGKQNALKRGWKTPTVHEVAAFMGKMLAYIDKKSGQIPYEQFFELKYEEFEMDPVNSLKKIYGQFEMKFTVLHQERVESFLEGHKNYKKNTFRLSDEDVNIINTSIKGTAGKYSYT